jgi:hypothetical protein
MAPRPDKSWQRENLGSNDLVASGSFAFANNAAAGTVVNVDVPLPAAPSAGGEYLVTVYDPSAVTDLAVSVQNKHTMGGQARYGELAVFAVLKGKTRDVPLAFWILGEGGRLAISNDTVLGAADGFTGYYEVRRP